MTTFRTSGKVYNDPAPWVDLHGIRHLFAPNITGMEHDPRPEYDHHNPVLKQFRDDDKAWSTYTPEAIREEVRMIQHPEWRIIWETPDATDEDREHAIRVLTRLANFREE